MRLCYGLLRPTATGAGPDLKLSYVKILVSYLKDMLLTKISMKDSVVLIWGGQNIVNAKCSVAESYVLSRHCFATAPAAFDLEMFMHKGSKQSLTSSWSVNKATITYTT
ncbi:MAG TPA: hypothetical protein PLP21_19130 [Pyrinomonadaceae bacterium]|nr:hypothetical protein [Acidobacteriota bacterium]HQZ98438.1 hypothetical protein [Pyrinomonadaceae bacterium]